jgi:hypothetical protein
LERNAYKISDDGNFFEDGLGRTEIVHRLVSFIEIPSLCSEEVSRDHAIGRKMVDEHSVEAFEVFLKFLFFVFFDFVQDVIHTKHFFSDFFELFG